MDYLIRSVETEVEKVLDGERSVVARINTGGIDRLRTIIDPMGCDTSHFNRTRSVLWNHGNDAKRGEVPIGEGWVKVRHKEGDMVGKTKFDPDDEFSELLFQKCKSGSLRGWSIKAGVKEASPPTKQEIRARPELADCETIYRKWDLIEYSLTPTPGNSDCVTLMVSRGLITPPEGFVPTETPPEVVGQPETRDVPYVEEVSGRWTCHDIAGRKIASYANESDARELLRAMSDSRSFDRVLVQELARTNARFEQAEEDLLARIQLKLWGVV